MPNAESTVGQYLADRLQELGLRHLFAVPDPLCGDWLQSYVEENPSLRRLGVTNALNAGYAADGYARLNGIGAACVPHGAGTLGMVNAIAGAHAERVPVVVITCGPGEQPGPNGAGPHAHPSIRMYEEVTCVAEHISDPKLAPKTIDRALRDCLSHQEPVYLELAPNLYHAACTQPRGSIAVSPPPLSESTVHDITVNLERADSPVIWAGAEIQRYDLEESFDRLLRSLDLPYVTTMLGKSVLSESHDHFAGVLDEPAPPAVEKLLRDADYVLGLGVVEKSMPGPERLNSCGDVTFAYRGGKDARAAEPDRDENRTEIYTDVPLGRLFFRLRHELAQKSSSSWATTAAKETRPATDRELSRDGTASNANITYSGFFSFILEYVDEDTILMSGNGLDRLGSQLLPVERSNGFVCQAAYGDPGHVTPAAIGVNMASDHERMLVFVGDGGFQMTAQCFGTMAENGIDPIIFVLNNGVYGSNEWRSSPSTFDRGTSFTPHNILQHWHYSKLPNATGGRGWHADTYGQLEAALDEALRYIGGPLLIDVTLEQRSLPALTTDRVEIPAETLDIAVETLLPKSS